MKVEVYSPTIRRREMDAVLTALVEDKIGPGEQGKLLIQIAREKLEFEYCLALRSPATALYIALKSLGLEEGRGVIISALSPLYYLNVIEDLKLTPLYADVSMNSANMNRETIENTLNSGHDGIQAGAIILHHSLGYLPDTVSIAALGLPLIEDRSQSYGNSGSKPSQDGNTVLTLLGLEERDMLTAGGGALLCAFNRRDASVLKNYGDLPPEYGLPDMNAAMGIVQFRGAAKNLQRRQEIAAVYYQAAGKTRHKCFINESDSAEGGYNNYAFPLILETGMKDVKAYARRKEIIVENAFERTLTGLGIVPADLCPQAFSLSLRTVLFPLYPRLRAEEIEKVARLILTLP